MTTPLLVYSHLVTSLPLSYYWFVLIPLQVPLHSKMAITSKMYCHYKQNVLSLQAKMYGTINQNVWVLQIKCMIITNQNVWALQIKCMVTINQNVWWLQFKCIAITNLAIYNFLPWVGHMTCLSKHLIPLQISLFSRSHDLIMLSIKFPFLVIS